MLTRNLTKIFIFSITGISLFSCKGPEPISLPGNIEGTVTDCESSEPIADAAIIVIRSAATYGTGITKTDGTFIIEKVPSGEDPYEVQASKLAYSTGSKNVVVKSAETTEGINICLDGIPVPEFSVAYLDFGTDLTSKSFTISNTGKGKLYYQMHSGQDWVTIYPNSGDITNETDTIRVTINRTVLDNSNTYKDYIEITSTGGPAPIQNTIGVYLNGFMDKRDSTYYKVVTIGSQTWMGENLNIGKKTPTVILHTDNNNIEKYCYVDIDSNCNIYGGYYQWNEAMEYPDPGTPLPEIIQGICPDGWHIPTEDEWWTLIQYLGGVGVAGGKLKETGTQHWLSPNKDATNESGFTALGSGLFDCRVERGSWFNMNERSAFWSATCSVPWELYDWSNNAGVYFKLTYDSGQITSEKRTEMSNICTNVAVRCVKDL
jgi:uncharacterized protein (TIGR02145 family)